VTPTVVDVVVRVEADGLAVSWTLGQGGAGPVDVCVGPTPEGIDHAHPVATVDEGSEVRLRGLGPGRHYVSVAPAGGGPAVVAADRRIPLEGALNFRDLGGYRTADPGRRTRWGRVFRSDALHLLTDADRTALAGLGLGTVYDLRRPAERDRDPSLLPPGRFRSVELAIGGEASEQPEILDLILSGELTEADDGFMAELYGRMLVEHAEVFGALLAGLAEPGALPALFHCTAGKDRTGVAAALLLDVLGVPEEVVLDDYELTTTYRSERRMAELRPRLEQAGVDPEKVRPFLSARRTVLEATLGSIRDRHGGVEAYLLGPAGLDPATLGELRHLLLTEP
jgi:protein-tyrosine phosphatase